MHSVVGKFRGWWELFKKVREMCKVLHQIANLVYVILRWLVIWWIRKTSYSIVDRKTFFIGPIIHTCFRSLGEIKQVQVDGWPYNQGGLSLLWAGGLMSSTLPKLFGGLTPESLSKDLLLAFYPSEFFGLALLNDSTILHSHLRQEGGRWWNVFGINSTHRMCNSGLVLWTSTSQTGQWKQVWRYFTIQLRQTAKIYWCQYFGCYLLEPIHTNNPLRSIALHSHAIKNGVFRIRRQGLEMLGLAVSLFSVGKRPDCNLTFLTILTYKELKESKHVRYG